MQTSQSSVFALVCAFVIAAGALVGVMTALNTGPGWDDPLEIDVMNKELKVEATPGLSYEDAKAVYGNTHPGHVYYGVVMQYAAHTITSLLRGTPWLSAETSSVRNITVRHVLTLLLAFIGAGALAATAGIVGQSRELGYAVGAILMSTPVFIGQSAINVKDVPVATGLTMVSCAGALLLIEADRARRWEWGAAVLVVLGTFIAVGTRTGAVALIAFQLAFIDVLLATRLRWREMIALLLGVAVGILLAVVTVRSGVKHRSNGYGTE